MAVLVIDVGGSHVKLCVGDSGSARQFDSVPDMTPAQFVGRVRSITADWSYDVISLGIPAIVGHHGLVREPGNLGRGWVEFDFGKAFDRPVRIVNDAAMQALGAYAGGRMLFLGMGTGVGSALVIEHVLIPLELGDLPWGDGILSEQLGKAGFERVGLSAWRTAVINAAQKLRVAFSADYVMLGGGKAAMLDPLPEGLCSGGNHDAFTGGLRIWEQREQSIEAHDQAPRSAWRIVHQSVGDPK